MICHTAAAAAERQSQWEVLVHNIFVTVTAMTNIHICLFACHTSFYNSLRTAFLPKVTNFRQLSVLQEKSLGRQSNFVALNDSLSAFCQVQPVSVIRDSCSWLVGTLIGWSPGRLLFRLPRCTVSLQALKSWPVA